MHGRPSRGPLSAPAKINPFANAYAGRANCASHARLIWKSVLAYGGSESDAGKAGLASGGMRTLLVLSRGA